MRRKPATRRAAAATTLGLVLALAACSNGPTDETGPADGADPSATTNAGGETVIRYWSWYREQEQVFPEIVQEFEAAHPGVKIDVRWFGNTDEYSPVLTAAVSAGDPPEIFAPHFGVRSFGEQGISADVTETLGQDFLDQFFDSVNQQFTFGGKQYAIGLAAQSFGLFYDQAILDEIGITVPETWDDLIADAPKITAAGYTPLLLSGSPTYGLADFVGPLITQASDDPTLLLALDAQDEGFSWDRPEVADSLAKLKALWDGGVLSDATLSLTYEQALTEFASGHAAFFWTGSWTPQQLAMNYADVTYSVAKTPAWADGSQHWTGDQAGMALALSNNSPNKEMAAEFVKFIFEPAQYARLMEGSLGMPSTKEAATMVSDPIIKEMTSWLLDGDGAPHILYGDGSMAGLSDAAAGILGGSMTPEQGAAYIQQTVEAAQLK